MVTDVSATCAATTIFRMLSMKDCRLLLAAETSMKREHPTARPQGKRLHVLLDRVDYLDSLSNARHKHKNGITAATRRTEVLLKCLVNEDASA